MNSSAALNFAGKSFAALIFLTASTSPDEGSFLSWAETARAATATTSKILSSEKWKAFIFIPCCFSATKKLVKEERVNSGRFSLLC